MVRARPKTKRAKLIRSRRCGKCDSVLNNQRIRCKKCGSPEKFSVPGKKTKRVPFSATPKALLRP